MKWKTWLMRPFTHKCLKTQLKLLLGSKEWMLFIIMLEMHTSPWEFKQHAHQRGDSGFQTARITLHWCELYESHLSNAKFPEPVSFLSCFFINYHLPFLFPCHAREKPLYWSHKWFAFTSYTKGRFTVSSDFSAASCLLRPQRVSLTVHWGLQINGGGSFKYAISFFKNRTNVH